MEKGRKNREEDERKDTFDFYLFFNLRKCGLFDSFGTRFYKLFKSIFAIFKFAGNGHFFIR